MEQDVLAKRYQGLRRRVGYAELAVGLGYLIFLVSSGLSLELAHLAALTGNAWGQVGAYLAAVGLLYELISLPLAYYGGHLLEVRFGLARQSTRAWLGDHLKRAVLGLATGLVLVEVIYGLIRACGGAWWYLAAASYLGLSLCLSALAPLVILPLFYRFSPIADPALSERLIRLGAKAGTRLQGAYRWDLSQKTSKANAALIGWGPTLRVIIADAMLERYTPGEIETVFAHELGHQRLRHLWRLLALQAAIVTGAFWASDRLFGLLAPWAGVGGLADVAGLPLLLLVLAAVAILALPLANGYSRRLEHEADEFALRLTGRPAAFISAMRKLAADNLAELEPSPVVEFLFHSHPSVARRIGFAEQFAPL